MMLTDPVTKIDDEMWVLLWSYKQNALHIEPLERTLALNRRAYTDNKPGDYRLLFVGYREDVDAASRACRNTLKGRERNRKLLVI